LKIFWQKKIQRLRLPKQIWPVHLRIKDQTARISDQNKQLEGAHSKLKEAGIRYEHEVKGLKDKFKAEAEKALNCLKPLKCFGTLAPASRLDAPFACARFLVQSEQY
jgi:predicted  nucleic acid-binding Zn-ribbon protein